MQPIRSDANAQLLLLLARETLSTEQQERARVLAADVNDWIELTRAAQANFSLPFVHHHLPTLGSAGPLPDIANALRVGATLQVMRSLRVVQSVQRFHSGCILPSRAKHAYFKGPALAGAFYRQPSLRICRDIDILIDRRDFAAVARKALEAGVRLIVDEHNTLFADDDRDINFMIRHNDVLSFVDHDGIHFELHRKIEKQTAIFPENEIFRESEPVKIGNQMIQAVGIDWLFCYVAYHGSRHFWSRLHWVADLHAIISNPRFDPERALKLAERIGLRGTVEATLQFAALTDHAEKWVEHLGKTNAGAFLEACLRGLPGDSAFEAESLKQLFFFDFANPWQMDQGWKVSFWTKSAFHRLAPNFHQYMAHRRSRPLEFLYVLENASAIVRNAFNHWGRK